MAAPRDLPSAARCVIVGGGVGGTSIAYHLAELGWDDVVLVDRNQLTSGSTFHSAGLVGQLRSSVNLTKMMMYSVELYRRIGDACGWVECGGIRLASSEERMEELHRQAGWAKTFGLPLELISPADAQELFPLMSTDGVVGAAWLPTDGYLDPSQLTLALAHGAREGGARIFTNTRVTGIEPWRRGATARARVLTERGDIDAEVVVIAGGMFSAELGRLAGVRIPVVPMSHQYIVTQPFRERDPQNPLPTLRDPDLLIYFREEGGGLVMGGYERPAAPAFMPPHGAGFERIPPDFNGRLLEDDWDRFEELAVNSRRRVPQMEDVKVTRMINGPEGFTPDNEFCLGETDVHGLFVAGGFCAHGLAGAGGVGKVMAEWIAGGEPSMDLWQMDVRRFGAQYRSRSYTLKRVLETYETYYDIHYPFEERQAGRPLRTSPAYGWHRERAAAFGEKSGWERVNWYESNAARGDEALRPRGWAGKHWSPAIGAEHVACREGVAIFDESSFAKLEIVGPGAAALLERLCDNEVAREVGRVTYTQMLNSRGGIECDFTVSRLSEERFSIVTGTAFGNHDREWIRRHLPDDGSVQVHDATSTSACFGIWGPRTRDVLDPLTQQSLDNEEFPYMTLREITIGDVPVRALRVTYVGELGWELYCPSEYAMALWRTLWEAGEPHGIVAGGYRAIDSMRIEKGYRVWGVDITPDESPYEAGLGFAVKLDKDFLGRDALLQARERGISKRLCCLTLEDPRSVALGNEPVRVGTEIVGRVTSGGYGYTVERSIAYAYLPANLAEPGTGVEVEIFDCWVGGEVACEPLWDPEGERVRA